MAIFTIRPRPRRLLSSAKHAAGWEGVLSNTGVECRLEFALYRILRYSARVRVISNRALREFAVRHREAGAALQAWRKLIERSGFSGFADLKRVFNSVDRVDGYYVFNIAGNRYRLVAAIHFNTQTLYVRGVLTHSEYDGWRP